MENRSRSSLMCSFCIENWSNALSASWPALSRLMHEGGNRNSSFGSRALKLSNGPQLMGLPFVSCVKMKLE